MNVFSHEGFKFSHSERKNKTKQWLCYVCCSISFTDFGVHTVLPDLNMLLWSIQRWGESWRANSFALLTFPVNRAASPSVRGAAALHWWPLWNAKDCSEVQTWWLSARPPVSDMTNLTFTRCRRGHVQGWTVAWKVNKKKKKEEFQKGKFLPVFHKL